MVAARRIFTPRKLTNAFEGHTIVSGRRPENQDRSALDDFLVRHVVNTGSTGKYARKRAARDRKADQRSTRRQESDRQDQSGKAAKRQSGKAAKRSGSDANGVSHPFDRILIA